MATLSNLFASVDAWRWFLVGGGAAAGLLALLALSLWNERHARAVVRLGVAAVLGGAVVAITGGALLLAGRVHTDARLSVWDRPVDRQRARRDGYLAAQPPARLGLVCAVGPLLLGAAAAYVGERRRARVAAAELDPDAMLPPRVRAGAPVASAGLGLIASGFAVGALLDPVPGTNHVADETTRHMIDRVQDVARAPEELEGLLPPCRSLDEELVARRDTLEPARVPGLGAAARRCVEAAIQGAGTADSLGTAIDILQRILRAPILELDVGLRGLVEENLAEVRAIAATAALRPADAQPTARITDVSASGGLIGGLAAQTLVLALPQFRACHEEGMRLAPALKGSVRLEVRIGRGGRAFGVSTVGSDLTDRAVLACVTRAVMAQTFAEAPEDGRATLRATLVLAAADVDDRLPQR
jgi:hypothetical protein